MERKAKEPVQKLVLCCKSAMRSDAAESKGFEPLWRCRQEKSDTPLWRVVFFLSEGFEPER